MSLSTIATNSSSFHCSYKNILGRTMYITDSTKTNTLYEVDVRTRRPQLTFHANGSSIATVNLNYGTNIEFTLHGREFTITLKSLLNSEFTYISPWHGGQEIVWKSPGVIADGEIVCMDKRGSLFGRFNQTGLFKNPGTVDFVPDVKLPREIVDEIVVVGLALQQYRIFQTSNLAGTVAAIV